MYHLRAILISAISIFLLGCTSPTNQFLREFPSRHLLHDVTPERFPEEDAIIILNETSYKVEPSTTIIQGSEYSGVSTTHTNVKVVAMLTEAGVKKYGSYEFEYAENYKNIDNAFVAKVRILKPDGSIELMPIENIERVNSLVDDDGAVLRRKVIFKIPNLAVNDVLQIETVFTKPFTYSTGRLFYLNEDDESIITNLYITLPYRFDVNISEFPDDRIPSPNVQQISDKYGSGETYFWSLSSIGKTYRESYSPPLLDRSAHIVFNVESFGDPTYQLDWDQLSENFYNDYHKEYHISKSNYDELGIQKYRKNKSLEWMDIDSIYYQIRSKFLSDYHGYLYPQFSSVKSLLKESHASPSDMAMLMYVIMKESEESMRFVLIRDEREGLMKSEINSFLWFDRIGVSITKGDEKRLYDFDGSIPSNYEFPWFLERANVLSIGDDINTIGKYEAWNQKGSNHLSIENHFVEINPGKNKISSNLSLELRGINGTEFRTDHQEETQSKVEEFLREEMEERTFKEVEGFNLNPFVEEGVIKFTANGIPDFDVFFDEEFISIAVKNYYFREFVNDLKTTTRHNNLDFSRPRSFKVNYSIEIPEGYEIKDIPKPQKTNFGLMFHGMTTVEVVESRLNISSTFKIKHSLIASKHFERFYSALLEALEKMEQPLVLDKIDQG